MLRIPCVTYDVTEGNHLRGVITDDPAMKGLSDTEPLADRKSSELRTNIGLLIEQHTALNTPRHVDQQTCRYDKGIDAADSNEVSSLFSGTDELLHTLTLHSR